MKRYDMTVGDIVQVILMVLFVVVTVLATRHALRKMISTREGRGALSCMWSMIIGFFLSMSLCWAVFVFAISGMLLPGADAMTALEFAYGEAILLALTAAVALKLVWHVWAQRENEASSFWSEDSFRCFLKGVLYGGIGGIAIGAIVSTIVILKPL